MIKRFFLFSISCLFFCITDAQTPWSNFKWGHDSVTVNNARAFVPRSAIFLPVSFNGDLRRYYLQLDLSSDLPILLYSLPASIDTKNIDKQPFYKNELNKCFRIDATLKGRLGNTDFALDSAHYLLMRKLTDSSTNYLASISTSIIGTIGLNYFQGKILIVDFPHEQFMILNDSTKVPLRYTKKVFYTSSHISNSRLVIPVSFGDSTYKNFFYETGSGIFDLIMSKQLWGDVTGKQGDETGNFHVKVSAWGKHIEAIGAPSKLPLRIGYVPLQVVMPFYLKDDPNFKDTYGCDGLIGNSPFLNKVIVIDFIRNRFGVFPPM
jgi:hypothetical protein